jgi:hypothetical protein
MVKTGATNKVPKPVGARSCQGVVFVYKSDETAEAAWQHVKELAVEHTLRGELHQTKDKLLQAIAAWSAGVDATGAMAMIYAHMGPMGMVPKTGAGEERVYWGELAKALGAGVHTLWLIGCNSELSTKVWSPLTSPVRGYLLATTNKAPFRPFLPVFASEVSMAPLTPFDKMLARIVAEDPKLGAMVAYYYPTAKGWIKGVRPEDQAGHGRARADEAVEDAKRVQAAAERLRSATTQENQARAISDFIDILAQQREKEFTNDFYVELQKQLDGE